jgi:hypothetical protein
MKTLITLFFLSLGAAIYAQPETVNVGSSPNDGTGDAVRTAFQKVNTNDAAAFDSIDARRAATVLNEAAIASLVDSVSWMGDTLRAHNTRLLAIGTGGGSLDSTYLVIQTDSLKTFDGDSAVAVADLYNVINDTTSIGDVVALKADTVLLWSWMIPDSALFEQSTYVAYFYHNGPDTMYVTSTRVGTLDAANTNFTFNVQHFAELDDSPETLFTAAPTVTGTEVDAAGEVDTPNNDVSIPPGRWIALTIDAETLVPARGASFNFYGYEY